MQLKIINPIEYPGWDELLLASDDRSFFHTSSWARVLVESYNYKPFYIMQISDGRLSVLLPVMEVNSIITGKRGVSLPFTDYCELIVSDTGRFKNVMEQVIALGRSSGWKYLGFRGGGEFMNNATPSLTHYTHYLHINNDEKKIFGNFKGNTRRNIRKAIKEGVKVRLDNSFESIGEFFRLNCITRKRHGLPPQPFRFFKKIYEHIISKKKGFVSLAYHKNKIIAGAVFFYFNKEAFYKYGASDMSYSYLRPNNLIIWEAIRWCLNNGFINLSLGITEIVNEGLLKFKRGWGPREGILNYYKYDLRNGAFVRDKFRTRTSYVFFRNMPSPLLKLTGGLIYRHFG